MTAAAASLRPLLDALEAAGALTVIRRPVSPQAHLPALAWQAGNRLGRGVRFDLVVGHLGWRAASQILADRAGWARAFDLPEAALLTGLRDRLAGHRPPVETAAGPVKSVRTAGDKLDLARLPALQLCARDPGRRVIGVLLAEDAETGRTLVSLASLQLLGARLGAVGGLSPTLKALHRQARAAGRPVPVALVVSPPPALLLAAALGQFRPDADLGLAGALLDAPLTVLRPEPGAPPVPAEAEAVVLGELAADDSFDIEPTGGPLGLYAAEPEAPVLRATGLFHRMQPILHVIQPGAGRNDLDGTLALATELLVAAHVRHIEGGIDLLDVRSHGAGLAVAVKLRPRVEGQSKTVLMGALSGAAAWAKLAIGVDEDVDAADLRDVFWSVASRTHADPDVALIGGMRAHPDDPSAPRDPITGDRTGTRWLIDSTMPPLTQAERRLAFGRAIPKNLDTTTLADFLPRP